MTDKKIFCVIPAYNEEGNIGRVIEEVSGVIENLVVVVDGASDETYKKAVETKKRLAPSRPNITILRHIINRGQGAALQTGNEYAAKNNADIIVHFDADGQFLVSEIKDLVDQVKNENFDIVFGSRFMEKKSNMPFFKRHIIMRIGRLVNRFFIGLNLTDPQNGFRVMGKKAIEKIKIDQDGSAHCSEILAKTSKNKLKFKEIPVTVRYFDFGQGIFSGKGRGKGGFVIIRDLIFSKFLN